MSRHGPQPPHVPNCTLTTASSNTQTIKRHDTLRKQRHVHRDWSLCELSVYTILFPITIMHFYSYTPYALQSTGSSDILTENRQLVASYPQYSKERIRYYQNAQSFRKAVVCPQKVVKLLLLSGYNLIPYYYYAFLQLFTLHTLVTGSNTIRDITLTSTARTQSDVDTSFSRCNQQQISRDVAFFGSILYCTNSSVNSLFWSLSHQQSQLQRLSQKDMSSINQ